MADPSAALDAALEALSTRASGAGPGSVVPRALRLDEAEAEAVAIELARRAGSNVRRALFCGEGIVFAGLGVSAFASMESPPEVAVRRLVAGGPGRRAVVALEFPASPAMCLGGGPLHLPPAPAWRPAIAWYWRDGEGVLSVDLGEEATPDDAPRRLLERLRTPTVAAHAPQVVLEQTDLSPDRPAHAAAVGEALSRMRSGTLEKVVVARRRRLRWRGDVGDLALRLWQRLARSGPDEVRYLVGRGDGELVGVTPELLCRRRGLEVSADVLAGTSVPGHGDLRADPKERREHEAVRRFLVDTLTPLASEVRAPETPGLRRLRHVEHLHTPVTATLREAVPVFDRLHPTPAVAGSPRSEALALIERLEPFERGLYAGAIGLADDGGETLWVALRCALVRVDADGGALELFAGSGIVPGTDPAREWLELDRKERTVCCAIDALCGGMAPGGSDAA